MIIPITLPRPSSSSPSLPRALAKLGSSEVVLIELQGSLEVEGDRAGQAVGTLTFPEDNNAKPTLLIGHHLLEGKLVTLQKPLAVLRRAAPTINSASHNDEHEEKGEGRRYDMLAIVRRKIVFSKRPIPVVNAAAVKAGMEKEEEEERRRRKKVKVG
ncbi:hypothetical protein OE88DRAFT_422511 [Heliocybe sulcata]|uniref:Chromosome transmission fidelity protein 8 n=1 Tax=Heliocybe sulcata TaxID=5364 RepID=A0A5C3MYX0_9AGAM|nr:hypothetical protein OE88DRAFT_422511 [Heliocybe sulcata]